MENELYKKTTGPFELQQIHRDVGSTMSQKDDENRLRAKKGYKA